MRISTVVISALLVTHFVPGISSGIKVDGLVLDDILLFLEIGQHVKVRELIPETLIQFSVFCFRFLMIGTRGFILGSFYCVCVSYISPLFQVTIDTRIVQSQGSLFAPKLRKKSQLNPIQVSLRSPCLQVSHVARDSFSPCS